MKRNSHSKLIILGSGVAAWTAAIYAARANLAPVIITAPGYVPETISASEADCWPGSLPDTPQLELIADMQRQAVNAGAMVVEDTLKHVDLSERPFRLTGAQEHTCDTLIIAMVSTADLSGIPGAIIFQGRGVSTNAIHDGWLFKGQDVAVIGGTDTAIETTRYLSNIARKVTLLFADCADSALSLLENKIACGKVDVTGEVTIDGIIGIESGVTGVKYHSLADDTVHELQVSACFIASRPIPATELFQGMIDMDGSLVKIRGGTGGNATATSVPGVFAAGCITDQEEYRQAITSSRSGCMAALDAERFLEFSHHGFPN